ncbi:hypothetical protein BEL04_00835 [Mucilaginibacter sp. PPCGB 2223]|uniref:hypothetical protein n=1 Tax=Mucilaginibacter sp. PPCGB 2223 TaxID=1886027 RepID=UPI00082638B6|nr:hypothetical protein [Mucilaginibacter sp. PPCGB 2223]OCX52904.1 hypothetical protein BEL04_00835 [Mucilaginibacter sp. PPCGB 2223]
MKKLILILLITGLGSITARADAILIKNFTIRENPFAKDEVAIVATDTAGTIQENISGLFKFTINGFDEDLNFENGTAFYHHKLDKSSFIFLKHSNEKGSNSALYYVYKRDTSLSPIHISWIILIAIPIILVLLAYMFKRFIIIAAILFCIFLYFNHHSGLSVGTFFDTVFEGLKHVF